MVLNEFIPFVNDWCNCTKVETICKSVGVGPVGCPDFQNYTVAGGDPTLSHAKGVGINRKTLGWNAAAGVFAYGFGTLAERGASYRVWCGAVR